MKQTSITVADILAKPFKNFLWRMAFIGAVTISLLCFAALAGAQTVTLTPDPACFSFYQRQADSLSKAHLASTYLTGYQRRARARLDSLLHQRCVKVTVPPVDTVVVPPVDSTPTPPVDSTPPIDTTPPVPVPPDTARFSGPAELPRIYLNFPYPAITRTVVVSSGGLQAAINNRQAGDELLLVGGSTWSGNFTVANCVGGWLTIKSGGLLPNIGNRMTPTRAAPNAKIITPNTAAALTVTAAGCKVRLVGVEIAQATTVTAANYGLVRMDGTDLVLDRVYVHGHATSNTIRCVAMNGPRQQVADSWLSECHASGNDAQAIWGGNGPGPYRIVNNYLEGSGENIMFGGTDPPAGIVPSDIEIRGNHIAKPLAWKGGPWTIKNLIETKNAARVLIEGNVIEGSWTHAQTGWAVIVKSANQSGGCRWCRSTDVTIRRNAIRNVGAGINIAPQGDIGPTDTTARRIHVTDNTIDVTQTGDKRGFMTLTGTRSIAIERNVLTGTGLTAAMFSEGGAQCTFTDNVWARGQYGVFASGAGEGTSALNKGCGASGWTWTRQTMVGTAGGAYPAGTTWVSSEAQALLAATIRATVSQATAGVVVPP